MHHADNRTPLEKLLSRFDPVRETGVGQFMVHCSAHADRNPSLSIKEFDDGVVGVHCFGGCETYDVMASVGLTLADLYPERLSHHIAPKTAHQRRRYGQAQDALTALTHESLIVVLAADMVMHGGTLSDVDMDRVRTAHNRIRSANEIAGNPLPARRHPK